MKAFFKKRKKIIIPIGVLLLIGVLVIFNLKMKGEVVKVQAEEVKRGKIKAVVSAPGRMKPKTEVNISSDIMGKITQLNFKEGDQVKEKEILALLDDSRESAELESATANLKFIELSFERKKKLFEEDLISKEEFQQAESEYKTILTRVETARKLFEKTRILSSITGVITQLNVEEGEIVVTGTMNNPGTVLMTISNLSQMEVIASVDESEIVDVRVGQFAEIEIDAYPDTIFRGVVSEIANTGTSQRERSFEEVTNFDVKVTILDTFWTFRPGMSATVDIITAEKDSILKVPIQVLVLRNPEELENKKNPTESYEKKDEKEKKVEGLFVINEGKAHFIPVKTGISDETHLEISEGIEEGGKVITGPLRTLNELKEGVSVKIEKKSKKALKNRSEQRKEEG